MTWARTSAAVPCALEGLSTFGRLLGQSQGPPCPGDPPGIHDFQPRYGWTTPSIKRTLDNPHPSSNSSLLSLFYLLRLMSRPSTPIFVPSRSSTPSPTPAPP